MNRQTKLTIKFFIQQKLSEIGKVLLWVGLVTAGLAVSWLLVGRFLNVSFFGGWGLIVWQSFAGTCIITLSYLILLLVKWLVYTCWLEKNWDRAKDRALCLRNKEILEKLDLQVGDIVKVEEYAREAMTREVLHIKDHISTDDLAVIHVDSSYSSYIRPDEVLEVVKKQK